MKKPSIKFTPCPGYLLIDPIEKDKKSDYVVTIDSVDQPHKGHVLAVGEDKLSDYGEWLESPVAVGDFVLFSIVGCERMKMEYKGDLRHEFVIAPFGRVLGIFKK